MTDLPQRLGQGGSDLCVIAGYRGDFGQGDSDAKRLDARNPLPNHRNDDRCGGHDSLFVCVPSLSAEPSDSELSDQSPQSEDLW